METKKILMTLALLCLVFGAASCGDSDDPESTESGSASTFTLKGSDS